MNPDGIPRAVCDYVGSISGIAKPDQGLTSEVVIIQSGSRRYVLKHSTGRFAAWLRYEYQVLLALGQTSLPTAKAHLLVDLRENDAEDCWLLADYLPGEQLTSMLSSPDVARSRRDELFRACGSALAAIHALSPPPCITNLGDAWLDTLIRNAHEEQGKRALVFDRSAQEAQARRETLLRIEEARPSVECCTLIHGDLSTNHVLFDGTAVTGIIDWPCATVGDPRYDIAQILCVAPEWATTSIDEDVMAFFEGYGVPPISVEIIRYYQELSEMGGQGCMQLS